MPQVDEGEFQELQGDFYFELLSLFYIGTFYNRKLDGISLEFCFNTKKKLVCVQLGRSGLAAVFSIVHGINNSQRYVA